ncbi:hypothetical protein EN933_03710 [Mesorhizobium sp. M7A.F.Ca.US.001.01.1.1]|nr:hypothetical protein EN933_03710 [Mesorhizobium sp. M7A.F.Ca.US.001.01.1.1]
MTAKASPHDRHFVRHRKAAKADRHLPTEVELLRGMPFLSGDIRSDIREFAERLSRRLKRNPPFEIAPLVAALDDVAIAQDEEAVQRVEAALKEATGFGAGRRRSMRSNLQRWQPTGRAGRSGSSSG